jgi:hypothetical protein
MSRAFLCVFLSLGVALLAAGCTTETPGYCDETTPCAPGYSCNPETHTCEPAAADGGGDGADLAHDATPPDGGGDGPPTDGGKLQNGAPCTDTGECASGFCVDGVCCDAVCDGLCRSCALAGSEGSCSLASAGQDPDSDCAGTDPACGGSCDGLGQCAFPDSATSCGPTTCTSGEVTTQSCDGSGACQADTTSCGGYACETTVAACKTSCAATTDCTGSAQCVGGKCVDQLPLGSVCGTNNQACASKLCVDGVCCNSTCSGVCEACDIAGKLGTCSPVADGTVCGASTCSGPAQKTEKKCASGSCADISVSCEPYLCVTDDCLAACTSDSQCIASAHCAGTACVPDKPNGQPCTADSQCTSGFCHTIDKVCCNELCMPVSGCSYVPSTGVSTTTLKSCKTGTCTSTTQSCGLYRGDAAMVGCLTSCSTDNDCVVAAYCDGSACKTKQPNGQPCTGANQCQSGICAEGVCCNSACDAGPCDSCVVTGKVGTCSYLPAGTPCNGGTVACVNATGSSYLTKLQCTGSSAACGPVKTTDCGNFKCTVTPAACMTICFGHDDCTAGICDLFGFFGGQQTCKTAGVCYVDALATCPGQGTVAAPHCKIQSCLDKSANYVAVDDGTYDENLTLKAPAEIFATGTVGWLMGDDLLPKANVTKVTLKQQPGGPAITSNGHDLGVHGMKVTTGTTAGVPLIQFQNALLLRLLSCDLTGTLAVPAGIGVAINSGSGFPPMASITDTAVRHATTGIRAEIADLTLGGVGIGLTSSLALYHETGKLVMQGVLIAFNSGGGIQTYGSELDVDMVKVGGNGGDGLRLENNSWGLLTNLLVNNNGKQGIYTYFNKDPLTFANVTVVNNGAREIQCDSTSCPFHNAIVWDKNNSDIHAGSCTFKYSDVKGGAAGTGNINADPMFTGTTPDEYSLQSSSPCVDYGADTIVGLTLPSNDILGNPRKVKLHPTRPATIDMGAYEAQSP